VALADAMGHDPRIGMQYLGAGMGFGGGCLPKDIRAFIARAEELGVDNLVRLLHEIDAINVRRRRRVVEMTRDECGGSVLGARIGVLGAAFKPRSDDVRDSPALDVAMQLRREGALVRIYDPAANDNVSLLCPELEVVSSIIEAASGADLLLHLTEWDEFAALDPAAVADVVKSQRIVDGRNSLDAERWRSAGYSYRSLGRR
jgi:UDPglucose 6-dehydrogenase